MAGTNFHEPSNLSDEEVIVAFHSFLQGALAQAHAERLLDTSILTSAESDIQVQGPAICLFLAAIRSEGDPPSISTPLINLNEVNCPESFRNWFKLWAECVPKIKALPQDLRHDLARIICDEEPQCQPILIHIPIIAQNLRAIAIQISQRRTFQERFNEDLNYALQYGSESHLPGSPPISARYKPPPAYTGVPAPTSVKDESITMSKTTLSQSASNPSASPQAHQNDPALGIIRETLYASLADVLYSTPAIHSILSSTQSSDSQLSQAYFAALCLAILDVSLTLVDRQARTIRVVQLGIGYPSIMKVEDCPAHLRPLISRLFQTSEMVQRLSDEDDRQAIEALQNQTSTIDRFTKIERLKIELEQGTNWESGPNNYGIDQRVQSPLGVVTATANLINALALDVSQIEAFREREEALFKVLVPALSQRQSRR